MSAKQVCQRLVIVVGMLITAYIALRPPTYDRWVCVTCPPDHIPNRGVQMSYFIATWTIMTAAYILVGFLPGRGPRVIDAERTEHPITR